MLLSSKFSEISPSSSSFYSLSKFYFLTIFLLSITTTTIFVQACFYLFWPRDSNAGSSIHILCFLVANSVNAAQTLHLFTLRSSPEIIVQGLPSTLCAFFSGKFSKYSPGSTSFCFLFKSYFSTTFLPSTTLPSTTLPSTTTIIVMFQAININK